MTHSTTAAAADTATAPTPGPARWFGGLGRAQQAAVLVLGLLVAVNLALAGVRSLTGGDPGGPTSSSFSTGSDGLEGYADLLRADGRSVERLRGSVVEGDLSPGATAVVADPAQLEEAEARALATFVADGGRLVLAGEAATPLLGSLLGGPVERTEVEPQDRLTVWLPLADVGAARELAGDRGGRLDAVGPLLPVAGSGTRAAVLAGDVGRGRVVVLADAGPLQNVSLDQADNAAFALAAAGDPNRPVVFVESVHGFAASGLDAVPPAWKWTAAGLVVALALGLWAAGTRFGPAEPDRRAHRPPRRDHVEAVAAGLDVTEPVADLPRSLAAGADAARAQRARLRLPEPSTGTDAPDADTARAVDHR